MGSLQVRVVKAHRETADIVVYELALDDRGTLPAFEAGAHIDVLMPGLPARQYSLCNSPTDLSCYRIAVLREPASRGGSRYLHERVALGDGLVISEPKNHFALDPSAERVLLLAGGIGLTPLLSMAEVLAGNGTPFELHYCARSRDRMAFAATLAEARFQDRVHLHFDDGDDEQKLTLCPLLVGRKPNDHLYICGPTGYLEWVRSAALAAGWPDDAVHTEHFTGTVESFDTDASFEIEVQESGQVIVVAKGQTALDAMLTAGLDVPNSCAEGVCGMCLTRVVEGTPAHRDQFLTTAERARNDAFTPCCSRANTPRLVVSCNY